MDNSVFAIINVNSGSAYARYNRRTYKVKEIGSTFICVEINGKYTDFSFKEIILVNIDLILANLDFQQEVKKFVIKYCHENKIKPFLID